jgi:hypothetical protein
LQAGGGESGHNTGEWSQGVHFVKPGLGIDTDVHYYGYAKGLRTNAGDDIPDAFGAAVVYRLGDLMAHTPYRDEPMTEVYRGKGNVSEDVTFRDEVEGSDYQYPLDRAYILPMANRLQLDRLRADERYSDLIEPGKPATQIAFEVARRALSQAGRSDAWIEEHLLPSRELVDPGLLTEEMAAKGSETKLFNGVARRLQGRYEEDTTVIVALSAKRGATEGHDAATGIAPELWQEELIVVDLAAEAH